MTIAWGLHRDLSQRRASNTTDYIGIGIRAIQASPNQGQGGLSQALEGLLLIPETGGIYSDKARYPPLGFWALHLMEGVAVGGGY